MAGVIAEDDGWKTKKSKQFLGAVLCVRFFEKSTTAFYLAYVLTSSSSLTDSTASPRYSCKDWRTTDVKLRCSSECAATTPSWCTVNGDRDLSPSRSRRTGLHTLWHATTYPSLYCFLLWTQILQREIEVWFYPSSQLLKSFGWLRKLSSKMPFGKFTLMLVYGCGCTNAINHPGNCLVRSLTRISLIRVWSQEDESNKLSHTRIAYGNLVQRPSCKQGLVKYMRSLKNGGWSIGLESALQTPDPVRNPLFWVGFSCSEALATSHVTLQDEGYPFC